MECLALLFQCLFRYLTTGIYNSWLAFDDLNTANQLSFILLIIILSLFLIENYSRGGAKYHQNSNTGHLKIPKIDLKGKKSIFPVIFCSAIFFLSFLFPLSQMIYWTVKFPKYLQDTNIISLNFNTLLLVILASLILISLAFLINFGNRLSKSKILDNLSIFSISGYAILGYSKFRTFRKIHVPNLKNSIFLISILIAIEIIKELPITLILRPFNFETFATKAYAYASQDLLEAAALPALLLIFWSAILIFFTSKHILSEK